MTIERWYFEEVPGVDPAPDFDGAEWRRRYFAKVGTVCRYLGGSSLVAVYCPERPPADRDRLRAELEAHPGNVNAVLDACDQATARFEASYCEGLAA